MAQEAPKTAQQGFKRGPRGRIEFSSRPERLQNCLQEAWVTLARAEGRHGGGFSSSGVADATASGLSQGLPLRSLPCQAEG
eukprot:9237955-Pyramimonas_sp.AAC.1